MTIDTGSQVWGARLVGSEDWVTYTLAEKAGGGGAASIFKLAVKSKPPLVAKIYNDEAVERLRSDPRYAARMILLASERAELGEALPFVVWPRRALFDTRPPPGKAQRHIIGYTMEYLPGTYSLGDVITKKRARSGIKRGHMMYIARTLAHQFSQLHKHPWKFVFGDVSPNNFMLTNDYGHVYFIDSDSYQFSKDRQHTYLNSGLTPQYHSPESRQKKGVSAVHDDFVLAVLIFQLFMAEREVPRHPFVTGGHQPDDLIEKRHFPYIKTDQYDLPASCLDAYQSFSPALRDAFVKCFTSPFPMTAQDWVTLLDQQRRLL